MDEPELPEDGEKPDSPGQPSNPDDASSEKTQYPGDPLLKGEVPEKVGEFTITGIIKEGGMAVVARGIAKEGQTKGRQVAVKLLKRQDVKEGTYEEVLFRQECASLARFSHDNIARFISFGYEGNRRRPYLIMELVDPPNRITDHCAGTGEGGDGKPLSLAERLALFLRVCDGIRHAHVRGVIHRDITPNNVLVGLSEKKPVVKIIDFGISLFSEDKNLRERVAFGTAAYMSPEQLEGDPAKVDHRSDLYALGLLLCEMMVGRQPYNFSTTEEAKTALGQLRAQGSTAVVPSRLVEEISRTAPGTASPEPRRGFWRRLSKELRGDIDAIVAKATAFNPENRYASVDHLAEDIQLHLERRPLKHALQPSIVARSLKFIRRNGLATAATVAILTLLSGLAVYSVHDYAKTKRLNTVISETNRELTTTNVVLEDRNTKLWKEQLQSYSSTLSIYPVLARHGRIDEAKAVLAAARHAVERGWEWHHLLATSDQSEMVLGFSTNDGGFKKVVESGPTICAVSGDNSVWFWKLEDAAFPGRFLKANVLHEATVLECASDGTVCHTLDAGGRLIRWSASSGEFQGEAKLEFGRTDSVGEANAPELLQASIDAEGGQILVRWKAGEAARLGVFGLADGKPRCISAEVPAAGLLGWGTDGDIRTAELRQSEDGALTTEYRIWKLQGAGDALRVESKSQLRLPFAVQGEETFSPLPLEMVSSGGREFLRFEGLFLVATWKEGVLSVSAYTKAAIETFAVSKDGGEGIAALVGGGICQFVCAEDGIDFQSGGRDGSIGRMLGHSKPVSDLSFTISGGRRVISASEDGSVRVWRPVSVGGKRMISLERLWSDRLLGKSQETINVFVGDLASRGNFASAWCRLVKDRADATSLLAVFDAPPWILRTGLDAETGIVTCLSEGDLRPPPFLQNEAEPGKLASAPHILGAGADSEGRLIALLLEHLSESELTLVAGDLLRGGEADWSVRIARPFIEQIAVSEDGLRIAANRKDSEAGEVVAIWDSSGRELVVFRPDEAAFDFVTSINFSPSGDWLAVGTGGGGLYLWKLSPSGEALVESGSVEFREGIRSVAFSRQEDYIAVSLSDALGTNPQGFAFVQLTTNGVVGDPVYPLEPLAMGNLSMGLAWSADGSRLASADDDGKLRFWALPRRDDNILGFEDCRLVHVIEDAVSAGNSSSPLHNVFWSPDGRWVAASNAEDGCYLFHAAEGGEEPLRRLVQLEFDEARLRVPSIAQIKYRWRDIRELKEFGEDGPGAAEVAKVAARVGVHPDEVTLWAAAALARMDDTLNDQRRRERKGYLDALLEGYDPRAKSSANSAARRNAIALAHYRLEEFSRASTVLAREGEGEEEIRELLDAMICAKSGDRSKAKALVERGVEWEGDEWAGSLWKEMKALLDEADKVTTGR